MANQNLNDDRVCSARNDEPKGHSTARGRSLRHNYAATLLIGMASAGCGGADEPAAPPEAVVQASLEGQSFIDKYMDENPESAQAMQLGADAVATYTQAKSTFDTVKKIAQALGLAPADENKFEEFMRTQMTRIHQKLDTVLATVMTAEYLDRLRTIQSLRVATVEASSNARNYVLQTGSLMPLRPRRRSSRRRDMVPRR